MNIALLISTLTVSPIMLRNSKNPWLWSPITNFTPGCTTRGFYEAKGWGTFHGNPTKWYNVTQLCHILTNLIFSELVFAQIFHCSSFTRILWFIRSIHGYYDAKSDRLNNLCQLKAWQITQVHHQHQFMDLHLCDMEFVTSACDSGWTPVHVSDGQQIMESTNSVHCSACHQYLESEQKCLIHLAHFGLVSIVLFL